MRNIAVNENIVPNDSQAALARGSVRLVAAVERIADALERISTPTGAPPNAVISFAAPAAVADGSRQNRLPSLESHPAKDADAKTLPSLEAQLTDLRTELAEIKGLLVAEKGEIIKEAYSVDEAAKKTKLKPFTVRQGCNKNRIPGAYKAKDGTWRIPHAAVLAIQNHGLPSA